ncbi:erythromycin esterase-like enzyme [Saccharomonospora marina XMU15]|uniref:Erythromycin esterase-like enzyme n=1 Tax=Saccharomonospora marina XMU15 TaxID=882083 RepID=H5X9I0_9PSEU|nr:erythromycin esterase family protein [Saccharomonospora marina]EHR50345.1 erythromycin esterase-like enzyme [Saccharomonospora marina XMU15]
MSEGASARSAHDSTVDAVRREAIGLRRVDDLDRLVERIGAARYVLLGEATHGTSDFYRWRAELTKRLITELGFSFVAVEGDWPDCHRLHRSLAGVQGAPSDPQEVLATFERWPRWMWANEEVADFALWLRLLNASRFADLPVGFHGLDVYSLWDSLRAVLGYLSEHEPDQVEAARAAMRCFDAYGEDPAGYGRGVALVPDGCADEMVRLLTELRRDSDEEPLPGLDERFVAEQNARIVQGAERYYRELLSGGPASWNVRDRHMVDTLERLMRVYGPGAKAVVWAHNSHIGDARATDMQRSGLVNVGQLVRERHFADDVVAVGFSTHHGSVVAADSWGSPPRRMRVPDARPGSTEALLHEAVAERDSLFVFDTESHEWSRQVRDHRAIGVVYRPQPERAGNYVSTVLADRYDALVHCDSTSALTPLRPLEREPVAEAAQTYPSGR